MQRTLLSLLLCAPLAVWAADATPDTSFYKQVAEAGMAEVDAGNLASEKATDPKVKDFAAMMVKDHTAANEKLKALATTKDVKLPAGSSVSQKAQYAKLKALSGDTFDNSYIKGQVKAHKQTVALLKKEIASGQDAEAKSFAQSVLPTVQTHLKDINGIASAHGISK
jgi:putative membrane protein